MKTRALALIALAVALGGCRENLTSVEALGFCAPPEDAAVCGVPACDAFVNTFGLGGGTTGTGALLSWIEWQNNMPNNAVDGERLNTNDFTIDGYEWEIISPIQTTTIRDRFASTAVIPASGTGTIGLQVIPPAGTAVLAADHTRWATPPTTPPDPPLPEDRDALMPVRVNIRAFGTLGDDTFYETGTVSAAVYYFNGSFTYACPVATDTLVNTCPGNASQSPVTLNCVAPETPVTP
jgi:hypothetical protein